jgi:hypothetical protein
MGEIISAQILWTKFNGYNVTHAKMLKQTMAFMNSISILIRKI